MFGVTRSRYQGRVEAGGSPQGARSVKADQKHGAPPAASTQPERSPGPASPHQRSQVMDKPPTFVGVDVSKHRLDVHLRPSGEHFTVSHDEAGVAALVERLTALAPALVVLEATGGMEVAPRRPWPRPACRSRSSIPARCAPSRAPRGGWRRPTASMPRLSPVSPRRC